MKTIFVKNGTFRGRPLVLLEFPFDHQLKDLVKTLPDADWNSRLATWTIPYSNSVVSELLALLKGKAWLDYGEYLRTTPHTIWKAVST